jgi:hypothetical protein
MKVQFTYFYRDEVKKSNVVVLNILSGVNSFSNLEGLIREQYSIFNPRAFAKITSITCKDVQNGVELLNRTSVDNFVEDPNKIYEFNVLISYLDYSGGRRKRKTRKTRKSRKSK